MFSKWQQLSRLCSGLWEAAELWGQGPLPLACPACAEDLAGDEGRHELAAALLLDGCFARGGGRGRGVEGVVGVEAEALVARVFGDVDLL